MTNSWQLSTVRNSVLSIVRPYRRRRLGLVGTSPTRLALRCGISPERVHHDYVLLGDASRATPKQAALGTPLGQVLTKFAEAELGVREPAGFIWRREHVGRAGERVPCRRRDFLVRC